MKQEETMLAAVTATEAPAAPAKAGTPAAKPKKT
jgi:hypothetical protein